MPKAVPGQTGLTIGDGLFGARIDNFSETPCPWPTFGNQSPNSLFFSFDPVAIDCVMYDFLNAEGGVPAGSDDYLKLASTAGLGTFEHGNELFQYQLSVFRFPLLTLIGMRLAVGREAGEARPVAGDQIIHSIAHLAHGGIAVERQERWEAQGPSERSHHRRSALVPRAIKLDGPGVELALSASQAVTLQQAGLLEWQGRHATPAVQRPE